MVSLKIIRILSVFLFLSTLTIKKGAADEIPKQSKKKKLLPSITKQIGQKQSGTAQGVEIKNMVKPDETQNLRWQRIAVGKEKIDGAQVIGAPKGSVVEKLGFQSGDVIIRAAGRDIHSQKDFNDAINKTIDLRNSTIDFKIIRGNQTLLLDYQISW